MILLIDNNDSFSYNVLHLLRDATDERVVVCRDQDLVIEQVEEFDHIVFSPGAGLPDDFVSMKKVLEKYDSTKSILGICLGHQAICLHYGGRLVNLSEVYHGVASSIVCDDRSVLFRGVERMVVGRYHSWVADKLPEQLMVTATDQNGAVMAVEHRGKRVYGVQFHPESYITQGGRAVIENFINAIS